MPDSEDNIPAPNPRPDIRDTMPASAKRRRRSLRLPHYNYALPGAYFVTICSHERKCLFGSVGAGDVRVNDAGRMAEEWWGELPNKFPTIETCEHVIMPNHFHAIVMINEDPGIARPGCPDTIEEKGRPRRAAPTLSELIGWFKTMTTNTYIRGIKDHGWPPFHKRLWQRSYYDHVIRNEKELDKIREYIVANPTQWELDHENPNCAGQRCNNKSEMDIILKE